MLRAELSHRPVPPHEDLDMANHKRGKPKNARAGCLMCKGYKMNNAKGDWDTVQEKKAEPKLEEGLDEHEEILVESMLASCCPCGDENC